MYTVSNGQSQSLFVFVKYCLQIYSDLTRNPSCTVKGSLLSGFGAPPVPIRWWTREVPLSFWSWMLERSAIALERHQLHDAAVGLHHSPDQGPRVDWLNRSKWTVAHEALTTLPKFNLHGRFYPYRKKLTHTWTFKQTIFHSWHLPNLTSVQTPSASGASQDFWQWITKAEHHINTERNIGLGALREASGSTNPKR